jgi:hypothetical protein
MEVPWTIRLTSSALLCKRRLSDKSPEESPTSSALRDKSPFLERGQAEEGAGMGSSFWGKLKNEFTLLASLLFRGKL